MDVYHNENITGRGKHGSKLTKLTIDRTFLWEGQEIFIPAVYVGKPGAVLDVCARISVEDMAAFFQKWNKKRRLSLKTPEDYELIDADNPGSKDFAVEIHFDGTPLVRRMSSSLNWYPQEVFLAGYEEFEETSKEPAEAWKNDNAAEKLMDAYGCDRKCCWHFGRISYDWSGDALLSPRNVSLSFKAQFMPVTAGYFTTDIPCEEPKLSRRSPVRIMQDDEYIGSLPVKLTAVHPATGLEYTLTLHECEQARHSFDNIGKKGVTYPEYSQALSYSISPDINRSFFDIRDCNGGDSPVLSDTRKKSPKAIGATAIFMAGKGNIPDNRMSVSSLHFEPVEKVRWRMVFQVQTKADTKVSFPIESEV